MVQKIVLLTLFFTNTLQAQPFQQNNFGATIGFTFNIGTHVNRTGIQLNGYYQKDIAQLNLGLRLYHNYKTLGIKTSRPELQLNTGLVIGYGNLDTLYNNFIHSTSNQTNRQYSIGYARNFYFENSTKQQTGTIALSFRKVEIIHENDAFTFSGKDRYRTGGILLSYRLEDTRVAINTTMWHGNTHGNKVRRIKQAGKDYQPRHGYKDLSHANGGKFSHGIVAVEVEQIFPFAQSTQLRMGIDSEKVRHFLQNSLVHDFLFSTKKHERLQNPHYPMLDKKGMPYLFRAEQVLKPVAFYFDVGLNSGGFY